jgi:anti-sigma B factor antagonist
MAPLRVAGEVDYRTAPLLGLAVKEALREGVSEVFVDLAQVSFFGAAGASALVVARQRCRRRGAAFAILRPSPAALMVLRFTDLVGRGPGGM